VNLTIINGGLGEQNFSKNFPNPFQTEKKEQSRKEFALNFIKESKLSYSNLTKSFKFKNLKKKDQALIRYYLKKNSQVKSENKSKKAIKKTKIINFKIASFIPFATIAAEYMIISFSFMFYKQIGFSITESFVAACIVELFFMILAACDKKSLSKLKWIVFIYSAFTVSYFTYSSDPNLKEYVLAPSKKIERLEGKLAAKFDELKQLKEREGQLRLIMQVYTDNELVTKGLKKTEKERFSISESKSRVNQDIREIENEIDLKTNENIRKSIFSWGAFESVQMRTVGSIFFFILIQLLSAVMTTEFFKSLRYFLKNQKKEALC